MRTIKEIAEKTLEKIKASIGFKPEPPRYQLDATNHELHGQQLDATNHQLNYKVICGVANFSMLFLLIKELNPNSVKEMIFHAYINHRPKHHMIQLKVKLFLRQQGFGTLKLYNKFKGYL